MTEDATEEMLEKYLRCVTLHSFLNCSPLDRFVQSKDIIDTIRLYGDFW
jgi:hypothetical protein